MNIKGSGASLMGLSGVKGSGASLNPIRRGTNDLKAELMPEAPVHKKSADLTNSVSSSMGAGECLMGEGAKKVVQKIASVKNLVISNLKESEVSESNDQCLTKSELNPI
jgi:hypothetical protein